MPRTLVLQWFLTFYMACHMSPTKYIQGKIKTQNVKSAKCAPSCVPKYTLNGVLFSPIRLFPEKIDLISLSVT